MEPAEFESPKTSSQSGFYRSTLGRTTANPLLVDPYATSDPVQLVLWYHGADISGSPFYSVDARHASSIKGHSVKAMMKGQGQRSSSSISDNNSDSSADSNSNNDSKEEAKLKHFVAAPYTDRTTFDLSKGQSSQPMNKRPALLTIQAVRESDAGIYWCRVDFRWTRTTISRVRLNVLGKFDYINFLI